MALDNSSRLQSGGILRRRFSLRLPLNFLPPVSLLGIREYRNTSGKGSAKRIRIFDRHKYLVIDWVGRYRMGVGSGRKVFDPLIRIGVNDAQYRRRCGCGWAGEEVACSQVIVMIGRVIGAIVYAADLREIGQNGSRSSIDHIGARCE